MKLNFTYAASLILKYKEINPRTYSLYGRRQFCLNPTTTRRTRTARRKDMPSFARAFVSVAFFLQQFVTKPIGEFLSGSFVGVIEESVKVRRIIQSPSSMFHSC